MIGGVVLDTSSLTDAATGATVYTRAKIRTAVEYGIILAIPTAALAAAWAQVPPSGYPFLALAADLSVAVADPLDEATARDLGLLLAAAGPGPDLVAAHVVCSARRRGWPVLTADPAPLLAIDPGIDIERLP
ncbi:MAG: hypothetical protein V7637_2219 [Mycobacteriales bacterium]